VSGLVRERDGGDLRAQLLLHVGRDGADRRARARPARAVAEDALGVVRDLSGRGARSASCPLAAAVRA